MHLPVELKIFDTRLAGWGFPHYGSDLAAGLDLHACIDEPLPLRPQAPAVLISSGIAFRIGDPGWCALVLPRSGLGHREGLVLGNAVGLIDRAGRVHPRRKARIHGRSRVLRDRKSAGGRLRLDRHRGGRCKRLS